jgi:hypothetical protein
MGRRRCVVDHLGMTLSFLCTDYVSGWDPLCNSGHLLVLVFGGLLVGLAAAYLLMRTQQWHIVMKLIVGSATVVLSIVFVTMLGFQL